MIIRKSIDEIERMRDAGGVVHRVLETCGQALRAGVTTGEIDMLGHQTMVDAGVRGLFKNYPTYVEGEGFPGNLCISVNEEVVHGIGGDRVLRQGDVISIDCGVELDGWCGDSARTFVVGSCGEDEAGEMDQRDSSRFGENPDATESAALRLVRVTEEVLHLAIDLVRPGRRWSEIARRMQVHAEEAGLGVVRGYAGHGIGRTMHEDPTVPNFWSRQLERNDIELVEGMTFAVEPMCTLGSRDVRTLDDGWTVVTVDGLAAAHCEHTIAVMADGASILTDGVGRRQPV